MGSFCFSKTCHGNTLNEYPPRPKKRLSSVVGALMMALIATNVSIVTRLSQLGEGAEMVSLWSLFEVFQDAHGSLFTGQLVFVLLGLLLGLNPFCPLPTGHEVTCIFSWWFFCPLSEKTAFGLFSSSAVVWDGDILFWVGRMIIISFCLHSSTCNYRSINV